MSTKFFCFYILLSLISCSTKKPIDFKNSSKSFVGCPVNGDCTIELIENSKLTLQQDGIGQYYPKIETVEGVNLYKISFQRKVDERIMDAQYQEVIYFEIKKDASSLSYKNNELNEANITYGRLCFCPGNTGYETISSGSFLFERKKSQIAIQIEIEPKQFPVLMKNINVALQ